MRQWMRLTVLAALLLGLALLAVAGVHWQALPRTARLIALVGLTLALNLYGARRVAAGDDGSGVLFLGGLAYGAAILLIGRLYHLGDHLGAGLFLWALGVLPAALLTVGVALALQCLAVAVAWACWLAPFAPPWAMPVFLIPVLWIARRRHSALLFLAALLATGLWFNQLLSWAYATDFGPRWRVGLYPFDLALLLLASVLVPRPRLTGEARAWLTGVFARLALLMTFPLTFVGVWRGYMDRNWGWFDPGLWATLAVLLTVLALGRHRHWLAVAGMALAMIAVHGWGGPAWAVGAAVAGNLLVLSLSLLWLRRGLAEGEAGLFFTGLGGVLLLALLRYLDLIGSDRGGAALLVAMAAVVWGAARYWRRREARP